MENVYLTPSRIQYNSDKVLDVTYASKFTPVCRPTESLSNIHSQIFKDLINSSKSSETAMSWIRLLSSDQR